MDILIIVAFVSAQMLFDLLRVGALNDERYDEVIRRPLVMFVGTRDVKQKSEALFIDQKMYFAASFASVGWVFARFFATQGQRTGFSSCGGSFPSG